MVKGAFAGAPLVLLILSLLTSAFAVQQTVALTTLFIRADGGGSRPYNPNCDFLDENYIGPRSPQRTPNPLQAGNTHKTIPSFVNKYLSQKLKSSTKARRLRNNVRSAVGPKII